MNSFNAALDLAERISCQFGDLDQFRLVYQKSRENHGVWISLELALENQGLWDQFETASEH